MTPTPCGNKPILLLVLKNFLSQKNLAIFLYQSGNNNLRKLVRHNADKQILLYKTPLDTGQTPS